MNLRPPYRAEIFEHLGSTHDEILARARAGEAGNLWIMARSQSAGRGRLGRVWQSPPGNFYASLLLLDPAPLAHLPELGFVAGVALHDAVTKVSGLANLRLKWPNDLVIHGAKLSGMLLEGVSTPQGRAIAAGFGINCASSPSGLEYTTACLDSLTGRNITPDSLLIALTDALDHWLAVWARGEGFARIRTEWLSRAANLNQLIKVRRHADVLTGIFDGIDANGRLLLRCEKESVTIEAGDVFLI